MVQVRRIGYTISNPRKVRPYEEEGDTLVRERKRFLTALALSIAAVMCWSSAMARV